MSSENGNGKCKVTNWHPLSKGAAIGSFTVHLASGLIIKDCLVFRKGESRWVGMPRQRYRNKEGVETFSPIIEFRDNKTADAFRKMVLDAVDAEIGGA
jgi:DNA-binding cell septation regulator SpoVG